MCSSREETALEILKGQITATGLYRYRFEGIVLASLRIKTVENLRRNLSIGLRNDDTRH